MTFRCSDWNHVISVRQDGSILADGRVVARIENDKLIAGEAGAVCLFDTQGVIVNDRGEPCLGPALQVQGRDTIRTRSGVLHVQAGRLVYDDAKQEESTCRVDGYRTGSERQFAAVLVVVGAVATADVLGKALGPRAK